MHNLVRTLCQIYRCFSEILFTGVVTNGRGQGEDQDKGWHRGQHCQGVGGLVGGGKGVEEEAGFSDTNICQLSSTPL